MLLSSLFNLNFGDRTLSMLLVSDEVAVSEAGRHRLRQAGKKREIERDP